MTKSRHGNKEAKKPRKAPAPPVVAETLPAVRPAAPPPGRRR